MLKGVLTQEICVSGVVLPIKTLIPSNGIYPRSHGGEDDRNFPISLIVKLTTSWDDGADECYVGIGVAGEPACHSLDKR